MLRENRVLNSDRTMHNAASLHSNQLEFRTGSKIKGRATKLEVFTRKKDKSKERDTSWRRFHKFKELLSELISVAFPAQR